jgi:hypothetical protein
MAALYKGAKREIFARVLAQVHLTVSRAGLVDGFSHYIEQGSEFDWHVAHHLLGDDGHTLVAKDGAPHLIVARIAGEIAFEACNPWGKHKDDPPNLVGDLLNGWSYSLAHPDFKIASLEVDCGVMFYDPVPPEWILRIERL